MALVPLRFLLVKVSAQASHGTCSMGWEKSDRGAYGRLSADFSADQQDTSAIAQIAGKPWENGDLGLPASPWDFGRLWVGPPFPLAPAGDGDEEI